MTVSDMDRAISFYSGVLTFKKISDREVAGETCESLEGVFGQFACAWCACNLAMNSSNSRNTWRREAVSFR